MMMKIAIDTVGQGDIGKYTACCLEFDEDTGEFFLVSVQRRSNEECILRRTLLTIAQDHHFYAEAIRTIREKLFGDTIH